jgi:hypothetical protein
MRGVIAGFILAAALGSNAAAARASVEAFDVRGAGVTADPFFTRDRGGCVVTSVRLAAFEAVTRRGGPPVPSPMILLSVYAADECTGEILLSADASQALADGDLVVQGDLRRATLATSVGAHDQVCGCTVPIAIDLTWTAIGPVDASRVHERFVSPSGSFSLRSDGSKSRQATAVGTVSDGSTNFARDAIAINRITRYESGTITKTGF